MNFVELVEIEIVYIDNTEYNIELDNNLYASIDLGIDNIATMILPNEKPILFNGRQIKAKNQYFNKQISRFKSELTNNKKTSKQIQEPFVERLKDKNKMKYRVDLVAHTSIVVEAEDEFEAGEIAERIVNGEELPDTYFEVEDDGVEEIGDEDDN